MVYFGKKEGLNLKEKIDQLEQEVQELQTKAVYVKSISNITFTRQVIEADKVVKYYSDKVLLSTIDDHVQSLITVAMEDIAVTGGHLVITQFVRRQGDGFLIEVYQYGSGVNIAGNLKSAKYQVAYTKNQ